jgi:hypothetical protein
VTLTLGPTGAPRDQDRPHARHRRRRRFRPVDTRLNADLAEWSDIVGHDMSAG